MLQTFIAVILSLAFVCCGGGEVHLASKVAKPAPAPPQNAQDDRVHETFYYNRRIGSHVSALIFEPKALLLESNQVKDKLLGSIDAYVNSAWNRLGDTSKFGLFLARDLTNIEVKSLVKDPTQIGSKLEMQNFMKAAITDIPTHLQPTDIESYSPFNSLTKVLDKIVQTPELDVEPVWIDLTYLRANPLSTQGLALDAKSFLKKLPRERASKFRMSIQVMMDQGHKVNFGNILDPVKCISRGTLGVVLGNGINAVDSEFLKDWANETFKRNHRMILGKVPRPGSLEVRLVKPGIEKVPVNCDHHECFWDAGENELIIPAGQTVRDALGNLQTVNDGDEIQISYVEETGNG